MSFFTDRKLAVKLWPPAVCRHCGGRPEANGLIAHCYICGWAIHRHLNPETGEVVERIPNKGENDEYQSQALSSEAGLSDGG